MLLSEHREFILAFICLGENLPVITIAACLYLLAAHFHQVVYLLAYWHKFLDVLGRKRVEVVVNMLLDRGSGERIIIAQQIGTFDVSVLRKPLCCLGYN